jgi:hypothetical protein
VPLDGVGYRGALPLTSDLASARLPAGARGVTSFLEDHRGGTLRMLAISGNKRLGLEVEGSTAEASARVKAHLASWRTRMATFKLKPSN